MDWIEQELWKGASFWADRRRLTDIIHDRYGGSINFIWAGIHGTYLEYSVIDVCYGNLSEASAFDKELQEYSDEQWTHC